MSLVLATLLQELTAGNLRVVDLTQPLTPQTPLLPLPTQWNNTPAFKIWELSRYDERGPAWYWNAFETGSTRAHILMLPSTGSRGKTFRTTPWIASRRENLLDLLV